MRFILSPFNVPVLPDLKNSRNSLASMLPFSEMKINVLVVLVDFLLSVKAATLIFISGRGSAIYGSAVAQW